MWSVRPADAPPKLLPPAPEYVAIVEHQLESFSGIVVEEDADDLLDVYENALLEIYEETTAVLKMKKQALLALKKN